MIYLATNKEELISQIESSVKKLEDENVCTKVYPECYVNVHFVLVSRQILW